MEEQRHCSASPAAELLQRLMAAPSFEDAPAAFCSLLTHFYYDAFIWIYVNVMLHPRSALTRRRLQQLAMLSGQSVEDLAVGLLSGFFRGYQDGRRHLIRQVMAALEQNRADQLRELSIQLGLHLNARHMLRSFSSIVAVLSLHGYPWYLP
jgi:hypothetical protein